MLGSMLNATYVLCFFIVKISNEMGVIMKQLSKLIKIINFKMKVPLSYSLVQLFLYKYITLKLTYQTSISPSHLQ